jgi:prepilin-type N-terminal cleavage/methylation domain-containing protein
MAVTSRVRGFTLIELVMVIVILGVLAAVAIPKFVDMKGDAERASVEATVGALRSARGIYVAKAAVCGNPYFYNNIPLAFWVGLTDTTEPNCNGGQTRGHSFDANQIRKGLMDNPAADLFQDNLDNGNVISFVTKSGRTITITNTASTGEIAYVASPAY